MKKKHYILVWIVLIIFVLIFFINLKDKTKSKFVEDKINNSSISDVIYENYTIKGLSGNTYVLKINQKLKKECFTTNTWYKLVSDNIIEKTFKIPVKNFDCMKGKLKFRRISDVKRWDIIVDNKWFIHKINSNVKMNLVWYKIYWQ